MLFIKTDIAMDDYMTKEDVKEYLQVGDRVIKNLFNRPDFPSVEIGRGKKVVRKKDLYSFLNEIGRKEKRRTAVL